MLISRLSRALNEAGYHGYSMSNNARLAYSSGKRPLSKWGKRDIIEAVEDSGVCSAERLDFLRKCSVKVLRDLCLTCTEWHHTSSMYNRTDFYGIDEDKLSCDEEQWQEYVSLSQEGKKQDEPVREHGRFFWLTWEGTRNHPRARQHDLMDAYVETRGSFYYVYDAAGNLVVKKKIGSNGTEFIND